MNRKLFKAVISFTFLVVLLITVSTAGAVAKETPIVSLAAGQSEYSATQDVVITVTISNPTKHSLRILKWFTPVAGLEEPVFAIKVDGKPVTYTGAIYKRPAPTGSDYITLKSGAKVTYSVNLGAYYDMAGSGQYEIQYAASAYNLFDEKSTGSDSLKSNVLSLKVDGRAPKPRPTSTPAPTPVPGGISFNVCTAAQQATLIQARQGAINYADGADSYLRSNNTGTQRYVTWFGLFTSSRYNLVSSHFNSLSEAWNNAPVTFDCKCKQNYYAYVYPNDPYKIYLCKVFWIAPLTGTDSQAGTLIHEMSHFDVVAGTDDFVYGQTGAKSLALTNPDNAVMNADNHEYFAENTPYLP